MSLQKIQSYKSKSRTIANDIILFHPGLCTVKHLYQHEQYVDTLYKHPCKTKQEEEMKTAGYDGTSNLKCK